MIRLLTVVACSHGTRSADGRVEIAALVDEIIGVLPDVRVVPAFVDVEEPRVADLIDNLKGSGPLVVVPLLLSRGFHTNVDIAEAVLAHPTARATAPLGPHPLVADVLADRVLETVGEGTGTGLRPGDHVVLGAAGSTNPVACEDVEVMAELLRARVGVTVSIGYAAGAAPRIPAAVEAARAAGADRVIVASYVLAPGYFADLVADSGGDLVTQPLGADPRIAQVVARRVHS